MYAANTKPTFAAREPNLCPLLVCVMFKPVQLAGTVPTGLYPLAIVIISDSFKKNINVSLRKGTIIDDLSLNGIVSHEKTLTVVLRATIAVLARSCPTIRRRQR